MIKEIILTALYIVIMFLGIVWCFKIYCVDCNEELAVTLIGTCILCNIYNKFYGG